MGWVEERWAARGWGGGEGEGIMEPTDAAARKGVCRKNEQAAPSLIPPSVLLFSSGQWALGYSTTSACMFGFPGL